LLSILNEARVELEDKKRNDCKIGDEVGLILDFAQKKIILGRGS